MRLLKTAPSPSLLPETEEFIGSQIPPYAILSHTWSTAELTLAHLSTPDAPLPATLLPSLAKVTRTLALARTRDALAHAWVDTVCIDKSSSAELAEAINSMFAWYADAAVCYVFLSDLAPGSPADLERDLPRCRWFTRGWTLQELIAPREVVFFDREWRWRGDKRGLAGLLSNVTGVPETVLRGEAQLGEFTVARRMSWAARRETTRVEDLAYCLLGIFDINLSLRYGEGMKAFARLQTAILQSTADLSVFAWKEDRVPCPAFAGMLAESPRQFASCGDIEMKLGDPVYANFAITTRGIQVEASLLRNLVGQDYGLWTVALNTFCHIKGAMVGVPVRKIGVGLYARSNPDTHAWLGFDAKRTLGVCRLETETLILATRLPTRYPFHSGLNPILGNRCSALQINWGPFGVDRSHQLMPRSNWDVHDSVFFGCNPGTRGWCASIVSARGKANPTKQISRTLFLACFGWNWGPPVVVLAGLDSVDRAEIMLLELKLRQFKFEGCTKVRALIKDVFGAKLEKEVIHTGLGLVNYVKDSTMELSMRVNLRQELIPDICVNPVMILDLS